jgi:MFS family permease
VVGNRAIAPVSDGTVVPVSEADAAPVGGRRLGRLPRRVPPEPHPPLMADDRFRAFLVARVLAGAAQSALVYAFLLLVVDQTASATFNSLFVICSILPAIVFGLPAGVAVDEFPRRGMLIALNLLRFAAVVLLIVSPPSLVGIFAATLALWTIFQFYSPTENAALVGLVPRNRLSDGQALYNLAGILAQLLGLVFLAPLMLKTVGAGALFAVCAAFCFVAAGLELLLPPLDEHVRRGAGHGFRSLRATLAEGLGAVRSDPVTLRAMAADVLIGIGMSALVVIVPLYLRGVLDTPAENTVFVFAPASLGLVLGLRVAPRIGAALGEQRVAVGALLGFALCVGALGFVVDFRAFLNDGLGLPLDRAADLLRIPALTLVAMLISIPAGFCSAIVGVAARSIVLGRTPPGRRGQAVATVSLTQNVGALVPTLLAGIAADAFGVERVAVAIAVAIAAVGIAAQLAVRPLPVVLPAASSGR